MSVGHPKEDPVAEVGIEDDDGLLAHDGQSLLHSSFLFARSGSWYTRFKHDIFHSVLVPWVLSGIFLVLLVLVTTSKSAARCKTSPDDQGGRYSQYSSIFLLWLQL